MKKFILSALVLLLITGCGVNFPDFKSSENDQKNEEKITLLKEKIKNLEEKVAELTDKKENSIENKVCCRKAPVVPNPDYSYTFVSNNECRVPCKKVIDEDGNSREECMLGVQYKVVADSFCTGNSAKNAENNDFVSHKEKYVEDLDASASPIEKKTDEQVKVERFWKIYSNDYDLAIKYDDSYKNTADDLVFEVCLTEDNTKCAIIVQTDESFVDYSLNNVLQGFAKSDYEPAEEEVANMKESFGIIDREIKTERKIWNYASTMAETGGFFIETKQGTIILLDHSAKGDNLDYEKLLGKIDF